MSSQPPEDEIVIHQIVIQKVMTRDELPIRYVVQGSPTLDEVLGALRITEALILKDNLK